MKKNYVKINSTIDLLTYPKYIRPETMHVICTSILDQRNAERALLFEAYSFDQRQRLYVLVDATKLKDVNIDWNDYRKGNKA